MSMLSEVEELLHKVEMSQVCLADMIRDWKTKAQAEERKGLQKKYRLVKKLEDSLRKWRNEARDFIEQ